jgi:hypothetical protein
MASCLKGLESGAILEALARELSTAMLGRVVLSNAEVSGNDPPLDWKKIDALYDTRNTIVHRGQRRMPPSGAVLLSRHLGAFQNPEMDRRGFENERLPELAKQRIFHGRSCGCDQFLYQCAEHAATVPIVVERF